MKALVYEGKRQVRLREVAEPQVGPDEVLVHVIGAGVCGSDLGLFREGMASAPPPLVPGHEFGGRLDDGSFVVVNPMVGCGSCAACAAGHTHICRQRRLIGYTRAGAFAERVSVPRRNLVPAPGLTPTQAALVEPLANGVHGWNRAGRPEGAVAIIGAGAIGMCLLQVLVARGLSDITVVDPVQARLDLALAAGASAVLPRLSGSFEAVFDAAGTEGTRTDAVNCTAFGGTVALLGLHDDRLPASAASLIVGDRTLAGCFAYTEAEFVEAVELAAQVDAPWAQDVSLEGAEAAIDELIAGRGPAARIKTIIRFAA